MIWQNGRPIRQHRLGKIFDYLWGGFAASAGIFTFCALWHYAALFLGDLLLPQPLAVFTHSAHLLNNIRQNGTLDTVFHALSALFISISLGTVCGLLAGSFKTLNLFLRPLITILLGMPPIVWVVLALFWFGASQSGIIFTIVISTLPLTFASSVQGMMTVDDNLKEMLQSYRINYLGQIKHLYLPHLLNYWLPASIVATGSCVKITVMAELLSGSEGIGARISDARTMMDTQEVLAYVVLILAIIMIVEYLILEPLRIVLMPWKD